MKLITDRTLVRDVAQRWAQQYPDTGRRDDWGRQMQATGAALNALDGETATAMDPLSE